MNRLRVWNGLAILSSLVCAASIVLWARLNNGHADRLRFERNSWPIIAADSPPLNMTGLPLDQLRRVWPQMHLANGVWVGTAHGDLFFAIGTGFWPRNGPDIQDPDLALVYQPIGRRFWQIHRGTTHLRGCAVPLWIIIIASAILPVSTAIAYYVGKFRRYRTSLLGRCRSCGYDLTANVSGICPECGTKVQPPPLREKPGASLRPCSDLRGSQ